MKRLIILLTISSLSLVACGINPAERNNAANQYTRAGNYDAAIRAYQAAQVAAPDNAVLYLNSAQALAASDRMNDAQAALEQAVQRGDTDTTATAFYNLGNLYFEMADYPRAVTAYKEALRLRPDNDDARYNLELALTFIGYPTPTAIEMQTNPENQQVQPTTSPSPNPIGENEPTPTPSPTPANEETPPPAGTPENPREEEQEEGGDSNQTPTPGPDKSGVMDVDSASRIMRFVEAEQENLPITRNERTTPQPSQPLEKDW